MTRRFTGDQILIATHNSGKLEEMVQLFAPFNIKVVGAAEINLPEPEETENTFVGNARIKALAAVKASGMPALSDDSGIEVAALNGNPGVYTADWAETPNGRNFLMAMERTHVELEAINATHPRLARFCSTLVLAWPDDHEEVFEGTVEGTLVWPVRGALGHGYDPMFQPIGHNRTFAEMTPDEKNSISHRADSFKKLIAGCFG
ncbi:MAG TPA: non-canonical purine NTP pyrophosphatase, RdgB/HAM1 family [Rhodobacteraceae bacterium]|jgi:XTP/dITP diphosphohydrolase|nr:RdgB/HAM1 family non-canonical purine NTP pyrophosphatase [Alphaproteobacteria bacterium]MCH9832272.1 RdgB/HAM1 family non-canonical purine NTP pyrophosphatase [Alphaproteobacteria bacterium]MDA9224354.1 RdgB/HAM1 family non-canonical purine NTP pyrophosphatase [Tateyamaria sp.]HAB37876.1 non-canonical purine NTP pyrophosphatase, RdgB/HAM1 family [Paracoccaceae bacterium]